MDFKQLPYLTQRDFVDPYLREDKKTYHPLIDEKGNPWDTCMISSRAMHLWWLRTFLETSKLNDFSLEKIEEVYFQMICDYVEDNYLKKGKRATRYFSGYHTEMLNLNFKANGIPYKYISCKATIEDIAKVITGAMPNAPAQPVIVGTDISNFINLKQGESPYFRGKGTPKGHIQMFVDVTANGCISKDPYGKAYTRYKDQDGNNVLYVNQHLRYLLADYSLMVYVEKI